MTYCPQNTIFTNILNESDVRFFQRVIYVLIFFFKCLLDKIAFVYHLTFRNYSTLTFVIM